MRWRRARRPRMPRCRQRSAEAQLRGHTRAWGTNVNRRSSSAQRTRPSNGEQRGRSGGTPAHRFCIVRRRRDRGGARGADRLGQYGRTVAQAYFAPSRWPTRRRGSLSVRLMRHLGGPRLSSALFECSRQVLCRRVAARLSALICSEAALPPTCNFEFTRRPFSNVVATPV